MLVFMKLVHIQYLCDHVGMSINNANWLIEKNFMGKIIKAEKRGGDRIKSH